MNRPSAPAWYFASRPQFLSETGSLVPNQLAARAIAEGLPVEPEQGQEWSASVALLQDQLVDNVAVPILAEALSGPGVEDIRDVILEFDFRRRGLRMDCLLLARGMLFVIEFKRSKLTGADRDQVMNYAVNLLEFHEATRHWCEKQGAIIVPVLVYTEGRATAEPEWPGLLTAQWSHIAAKPFECDAGSLREALLVALTQRASVVDVPLDQWLLSPFMPSSSILDAALSLYSGHEVSAIREHAAPREAIEASTAEIRSVAQQALKDGRRQIVFLSGAPGAGKTLVGLDLALASGFDSIVFVTGNAPLVKVLDKALQRSYLKKSSLKTWVATGYAKASSAIARNATYKIVKAHDFLGRRGERHGQLDGRVVVFDEAQRTYRKGKEVLRQKLLDHEADLILKAQEESFPEGGSVIVALIGHNQAINKDERGIIAWLEAAERFGWRFSIGDPTLAQEGLLNDRWGRHPLRSPLVHGHLSQSMRFYRNHAIEKWAGYVLEGRAREAAEVAALAKTNGDAIWVTRDLGEARRWAKQHAVGGLRTGLLATHEARRLAAEGVFVDLETEIAPWMLAPASDIRSSNALETVQNQYSIQGLELDYTIVCWDADFRWDRVKWEAFKLNEGRWKRNNMVEVARNGYRVLLTRARKGMVIFVPRGDLSRRDATRDPAFYDSVSAFLLECGAVELREAEARGQQSLPA